jgi:hypothetical protein
MQGLRNNAPRSGTPNPADQRDNEDHEDPAVDGEERPVQYRAEGIDGDMLVALRFPDRSLRVFFSGTLVQCHTDAPGVFFRDGKRRSSCALREMYTVYTSDPVGVAELVELAGLPVPDIRKTLLDCDKGILAHHQRIDLRFHEPGDHLVVRLAG